MFNHAWYPLNRLHKYRNLALIINLGTPKPNKFSRCCLFKSKHFTYGLGVRKLIVPRDLGITLSCGPNRLLYDAFISTYLIAFCTQNIEQWAFSNNKQCDHYHLICNLDDPFLRFLFSQRLFRQKLIKRL